MAEYHLHKSFASQAHFQTCAIVKKFRRGYGIRICWMNRLLQVFVGSKTLVAAGRCVMAVATGAQWLAGLTAGFGRVALQHQ